jgi:hypothetical protein
LYHTYVLISIGPALANGARDRRHLPSGALLRSVAVRGAACGTAMPAAPIRGVTVCWTNSAVPVDRAFVGHGRVSQPES